MRLLSNVSKFPTIQNLPPLRDVINTYGLKAEKSLGQNFLLDSNITDKIASFVRQDITPDTTCIEIGPGPGGLTRSLLKTDAKKICAVEFDERAVNALQDLLQVSQNRLKILHQDALKTDICNISEEPRIIIANLPYNIATPLLVRWLKKISEDKNSIQAMALMFQKEVAERIVASVSSKAFGRLSIISQWLCEVKIVYDLPPSAFIPPPKVSSAVVYFKPKNQLWNCSFNAVEEITAAAFNQRRKMIRSSLKPYLDVIENLGIDPSLRAENLAVADFLKIAEKI